MDKYEKLDLFDEIASSEYNDNGDVLTYLVMACQQDHCFEDEDWDSVFRIAEKMAKSIVDNNVAEFDDGYKHELSETAYKYFGHK